MTCSRCAQRHEQGTSYELGFESGDQDELDQEAGGDFVEDFEAAVRSLDFEDEYDEGEYDDEGGYDEEYGADFEARGLIGGLDLEQGDEGLEPEIIGTDTRVRVLTTTKSPFRFVCNLEFDVPGLGRRSIGTGTLIGPRTVLTAGHCLHTLRNGRDVLLDPKRMRVVPGRNGTLEPLPATAATRFIPFPGYRRITPTDIGIIHLANPIGSTVGYWTRTHAKGKGDPIGTSILSGSLPLPPGKLKVNLSGYPADKPGGKKAGCRDPKRPASLCRFSRLHDPKRSASCGTQQYRSYELLVQRSGRVLHYLNDTCPGHSGSPVWVRRHPSMGGRVLIAVHIDKDQPPAPVANRAVMIDGAVRKFIVANTR